MAGELAKQVGERIRQRRLEVGMHRQRDLADRVNEIARERDLPADVDNQRISDWERGVNKPSDRYISLLADALDRDVGWFYGRNTGPTPDLIDITARAEQVDGGFEEFREHVAALHERMDRIEQALTGQRADLEAAHHERVDLVAQIMELLTRQSTVLENIEVTLARLGVTEDTSLVDSLEQGLKDVLARTAPPLEPPDRP